MAEPTAPQLLPFELVFNPHWWHRTAGVSFDQSFYLDPQARIANDVLMRRVLYERFGELGLGERDPQPRPVIGSLHVAGGFVIPALLGAEIRFEPANAPQPLPVALSAPQIDRLEKPDFRQAWPMNELIRQMDALQDEWGYLVGDLNTDGLLNAAYHLYGADLFADFHRAPERVSRLLAMIGELIVDVAEYVRGRTGSCSIAVNRMAARVDPRLFLHANCSVLMISPRSYRQLHLPVELDMAGRIRPFGIHHCGDNLQRYAGAYAELAPAFVDVGWGSDVAACRRALPDAFLNLRLSPARLQRCTPAEAAADTAGLLRAALGEAALGAVDGGEDDDGDGSRRLWHGDGSRRLREDGGRLENIGVCCINLDYGTPDENLYAVHEVIQAFREGNYGI